MEVRERETKDQNNPSQSNQESSPIFTYGALNSSHPDQFRFNLHQRNHFQGNPDPDPAEPPPPSSDAAPAVVRYRECLKNHAANMGSHVVDGCGEFMANGEEGTPESLKCAACDCHRNFHRREVDGESQSTTTRVVPVIHNPPPRPTAAMQPISHHHHHRYHHQMPPMMMAFGGGGTSVAPTESSSEDLAGGQHMMEFPSSKKRFRTKFTEEQKEKMQDFAEKIGWKIQKQDEQDIRQFCNEVGLKRQVFKVWMHNCKQAMKKKQP